MLGIPTSSSVEMTSRPMMERSVTENESRTAVHWSERLQVFIAETARPIAIIGTTIGVNASTVIVAMRIMGDAAAAAIFVGALFSGLGALYAAKAWEKSQEGKHAATVEVAKATAPVAAEQPKAGE